MGRGMLLLRDAVLGATDSRYEGARDFAEMLVTSVEKDSTGGTISGRGTISGAGEDSVPMRGVTNTQEGDTILVSYPKGNPSGMKKYEYHIRSANPAPQIIVDATLPDPVFAIVPYTSDIIASPGSVLANMVVFFQAVEARYFPEGYTASFKVAGGEWRESGFAPHLGGAQQILLGNDFTPGTSIQVRLRAHYARSAVVSPGLDTRTFVVATDNITPGTSTGITVDVNIPGGLKITPSGVYDLAHFDHHRYYIATSSGGAGLQTLDGPTAFVFAGTPGPRYIATAPVSKSGVVGGRYPSTPGTYVGPYTIVDFAPPLDTTPPPQWAAPSLSQTTNSPASGGEEHWLTVTLNTNANYANASNPVASVPDYDYTLVTISGTGFARQDRIDPGSASIQVLVQAVGVISVTVIGVDKLGNRGTASTAATITVSPTGVPGTMGNVTTSPGSLAIVIKWTTIATALGYKLFRATSAAGAGATQIATIDGSLYVDEFSGANIVGANTDGVDKFYYKVQAFNLKGDGTISPAWTLGTVGAYDGSNITVNSVTANKLEANLILGTIIRTPNVASGWVGMYANAGASVFAAYNNAGTLTMALYGTGLYYYRDGSNLRAALTQTGLYLYRDTGANILRAAIDGNGFALYQSGGTSTRILINDSGLYIYDSSTAQGAALYEVSGKIIFSMPYFVVDQTRVWVDFTHLTGGIQMNTSGGLVYLVNDSSAEFRFDVGAGRNLSLGTATLISGDVHYIGQARDTTFSRIAAGYLQSSGYLGAANGFYTPGGYVDARYNCDTGTIATPTGSISAWISHHRAISTNSVEVQDFFWRFQGTGGWQGTVYFLRYIVDNGGFLGGSLLLGSTSGGNAYWALGQNTTAHMYLSGGNSIIVTTPMTVQGFLTKSGGGFRIPHPDPAKPDRDLYHGFVESPTIGENLYRFVVAVLSDQIDRELSFDLPSYFPWLNDNAQCWVTPLRHYGQGWAEVSEDRKSFKFAANGEGVYNVVIIATRIDDTAKKYWNELGSLEPPRKELENVDLVPAAA